MTKAKIVLNIEPEYFSEFIQFTKTPEEDGETCAVCKRTHKYLKGVARREMKKAGWT